MGRGSGEGGWGGGSGEVGRGISVSFLPPYVL